jgi:hypothetical protein
MALVERIMGLEEPHIPVHDFFSAQSEVARAALTVAQVKSFLQMDVPTAAEYDVLIALAPVGATTAARLNRLDYINQMHSVFILAEKQYPQYSTAAEIRLKLGI